MLQFYSSSNGLVNSDKAMRECLASALAGRSGEAFEQASLIVIHTTIGHDFQELLAAAHDCYPNATVVGCTCAGIIGVEGANESMRALGIMVVEPEQAGEFGIAYCDNIRGHNSLPKVQEMAQQLKEQVPGVNMVHLLASGIDIAADVAGLPARVSVDATRLRQVLVNLAGNGVKFTATGGVTVAAHAIGPGDGDTVRIAFSVADTGPGVAPGDVERIFGEFEQGDTALTRRHGGAHPDRKKPRQRRCRGLQLTGLQLEAATDTR